MKYVSEKYEAQLRDLAELLVTPERLGNVAVSEAVQLSLEDELTKEES